MGADSDFVIQHGLVGHPGTREDYSITGLQKKDQWQTLIELLVSGETVSSAARIMGRAYTWVRCTCKNPEFLAMLSEASDIAHKKVLEQVKSSREYIQQRLEDISEQGLDELERLINEAKEDSVRLKAVDSALDRNPATSRHTIPTPQSGAGGFNVNQFGFFLQQAVAVAGEIDERSNHISRVRESGGPSASGKGEST
jgi:hypothetical protein